MMKKGSPYENKDMVTDSRPCFFKIYSPELTTEHVDANGMERINMSDPRTRQQPTAPENYQARPCHLRQPSALKKLSEVSCSRQKIKLEGIDQPYQKGKEKAIERKFRRDGKKPLTRETRPCSSTKKMPCKKETALNQKAAKSFTSEFPHFERCLKTYNVQKSFILNIPTAFARKYLPDEKTEGGNLESNLHTL